MTMIVRPTHFDVSIRPVKAHVTTDGVQYLTTIDNQSSTYKDLFSIDTDTDYPLVIGKLAYVYVNISLSAYTGADDPTITYRLEAKNKALPDSDFTAMSAAEEWAPTGDDEANHELERIEGFLLLTTGLVDTAPLSIRLRFKSDSTDAAHIVYMRLKNDTVIQLVGTHRAI